MLDKFKDECGVFGIHGHSEAANLAYLGLYAMQHRGQESAGIAASDGHLIRVTKAMGHVAEAQRIAKLSPTRQIVELNAIRSKLTAPPTPTKVPAPIVPNSSTASVEKRLEDADYDDFVKIRRKQIAARNGR